MIEQVLQLRGSPTVILATGDPMWFGIGATLARYLPRRIPHPLAPFGLPARGGAAALAAAVRW
jgi:hypothetical protein